MVTLPQDLPQDPPQGPQSQSALPQDPERRRVYEQELAESRKRLEHRDAQLIASYRLAMRTDPSMVADAREAARQLGQPQELLERNIDVAKETMRVRALRDLQTQQRHPVLFDSLQRTEFLRLAHDDVDALATAESTWGWLKRNWRSGLATNERGVLGSKALLGLGMTEQERDRLEELNVQLGSTAGGQGFGVVPQILGQLAGTLPTALAAGAAAGGAVSAMSGPAAPLTGAAAFSAGFGTAMFGQSATIEGGNAYLDMIDQGYDHSTASVAAAGVGLVNGALDLVGVGYVAKPFKSALFRGALKGLEQKTTTTALSKFVREYATSALVEASTEGAQKFVNIIGDEIARAVSRPDLPSRFASSDGRWAVFTEISEAFTQSLLGMSVLSLPGPMAHYVRSQAAVAQATQAHKFMQQLSTAAKASEVAERAPDEFSRFVAAAAKGKAETVFIDGKELDNVLRQTGKADEFRQDLPEAADAIADAVKNGTDVAIPIGDYTAKVARSDLHAALLPHVKLDENGVSMTQAEQIRKDMPEMFAEAQKAAKLTAEQRTAFDESAARVEDSIRQQITATGRLPAAKVRGAARFYRAHVEAMALRLGITPEEFYQRYPVTVAGGTKTDADTLRQFAGSMALTVDADKASEAFRRLEAGEDPEVVRQQTGFHRGVDGRLRFEIDDSQATVNLAAAVDGAKLGDVLKHSALYAAYPDLAKVEVSRFEDGADHRGFFNPLANMLGVSDRVTSEGEFMNVLLHELQHAIQFREDFAKGGSPSSVSDDVAVRAFRDMQAERAAKIRKENPDAAALVDRIYKATGAERAKLRRAARSDAAFELLMAEEWAQDPEGIAAEAMSEGERAVGRFEAYRRLAGEVEARATATRAGMSEGLRRMLRPESSEDVPRDKQILRQPARGEFDPATLSIRLLEASDASTFLHESGHLFLHSLLDIASKPNAPASVTQDAQTFLVWAGVKDLETWNAMTLDEQRQHHEAFAYNFELYLHEGKAPSKDLEGLFSKFVAWLKHVYRSVVQGRVAANYKAETGKDLPILTGEIRGVMDRLLAADDAIAHAADVRGFVPLFQDQKASGMDDAAWTAYQEQDRQWREAAASGLARASLRTMHWLQGARSRVLKEIQAKVEKQREKVRKTAAETVGSQPVYRAIAAMQAAGEAGVENKMARSQVLAILGEGADLGPLRDMVRVDGNVSPDVAAPMFGFRTGEEMLRAILAAPPLEQAIDAEVDRRMVADHADLVDPKAIEDAVERALHNEARVRFLADELNALTRSTAPVRDMVAAAREAARQAIASRPVGDVRPSEHSIAAGRASREAWNLAKKGDHAGAILAKRRELLHTQLAIVADEVRDEVRSARNEFDRFFGKDESMAKSRNMDFVVAGRAILTKLGLDTDDKSESRIAYQTKEIAKIAEYSPEMWATLEPLVARAEQLAQGRGWKDLTVAEFRDVRELVEGVWFMSKKSNERKQAAAAAIDEMLPKLQEMAASGKPRENRTLSDSERRWFHWVGSKARLRRVEHWARGLDGGEFGPFTKHLFQGVREAETSYQADKDRLLGKLVDIVRGADLSPGAVVADELGGFVFKDKDALLGAILHSGNESNLRKMLFGRKGWHDAEMLAKDRDLAFAEAAGRWRAFLKRMFDSGRVTKADMDMVQAIWDQNEKDLKPIAQKAHRSVFGYYFKEIEAAKVATPWGDYRGGYVPAKVDVDEYQRPDLKERAGIDGLPDQAREFADSMPSAGHGFTISRNESFAKPLLLSVRSQAKHVDDVLRFAHMQPAIRDVLAIIRNDRFADAMNAAERNAINGMLLPWLDRTARQQVVVSTDNKLGDAIWTGLRRNAGLSVMFANVVNAAQQVTGIGNAALYVKAGHLNGAFWRTLTGMGEMSQVAAGKSAYMNQRLSTRVAESLDEISTLLQPSTWQAITKGVSRHAYFMQRFVQERVDVTVWTAAYDQSMASGITEAEAVREADSIVRRSQGSSSPTDVAAYEVNTPFARLFTQFGGYFNTILNQIWSAPPDAKLRATLLALTFPTVAAGIIAGALSGGSIEDEDKDGYGDELAAWFFGGQLKAAASLVPAVGPAISSLFASEGDRMSLSPSVSLTGRAFGRAVQAIYRVGDGDAPVRSARDVRDLGTLLTLLSGLPVAPLTTRAAAVADGGGLLGAITGRAAAR